MGLVLSPDIFYERRLNMFDILLVSQLISKSLICDCVGLTTFKVTLSHEIDIYLVSLILKDKQKIVEDLLR